MLCSRCQHDNPEENRYCGMCGARLQAPPEPAKEASLPERQVDSQPSSSSRSSILGLDTEPGRGQPLQREPSISGPSFLGIGAEQEQRSTSYLFDQEEPRSHRGLWITLVLLVAIALVGLQFRAEVRALGHQLYAAVLERVYPQAPVPVPSTPNTAPADSKSSAQSATPPPSSDLQANASSTREAQPQSAASTPTESKSAENAATAAASNAKSDSAASAKSNPEPAKPCTEAAKSDDGAEKPAPAKAGRQPRKAASANRTKSVGQETASSEDNHLLQMAQKYLHGQGVRRDCQQGMIYLREALRQPSAAAASQMGALYATGTCVPFDRVQAYRWFGSALQMTPRNQWLAQEREQLYAQMNSAERRQADSH